MWPHRLHNSIGLSVQADLYFDGKWTGLSSSRRSDVAQVDEDAQAVCERLNLVKYGRNHPISSIFVGNGSYLLNFGPFSSVSVFYEPKTPEKHEN